MIVSMDIRDVQGFALRVRNKNKTDTSIATSPLSSLLLHNHVYKLLYYTLLLYNHVYTRTITYSILVCGSVGTSYPGPGSVFTITHLYFCKWYLVFQDSCQMFPVMWSDEFMAWRSVPMAPGHHLQYPEYWQHAVDTRTRPICILHTTTTLHRSGDRLIFSVAGSREML